MAPKQIAGLRGRGRGRGAVGCGGWAEIRGAIGRRGPKAGGSLRSLGLRRLGLWRLLEGLLRAG